MKFARCLGGYENTKSPKLELVGAGETACRMRRIFIVVVPVLHASESKQCERRRGVRQVQALRGGPLRRAVLEAKFIVSSRSGERGSFAGQR